MAFNDVCRIKNAFKTSENGTGQNTLLSGSIWSTGDSKASTSSGSMISDHISDDGDDNLVNDIITRVLDDTTHHLVDDIDSSSLKTSPKTILSFDSKICTDPKPDLFTGPLNGFTLGLNHDPILPLSNHSDPSSQYGVYRYNPATDNAYPIEHPAKQTSSPFDAGNFNYEALATNLATDLSYVDIGNTTSPQDLELLRQAANEFLRNGNQYAQPQQQTKQFGYSPANPFGNGYTNNGANLQFNEIFYNVEVEPCAEITLPPQFETKYDHVPICPKNYYTNTVYNTNPDMRPACNNIAATFEIKNDYAAYPDFSGYKNPPYPHFPVAQNRAPPPQYNNYPPPNAQFPNPVRANFPNMESNMYHNPNGRERAILGKPQFRKHENPALGMNRNVNMPPFTGFGMIPNLARPPPHINDGDFTKSNPAMAHLGVGIPQQPLTVDINNINPFGPPDFGYNYGPAFPGGAMPLNGPVSHPMAVSPMIDHMSYHQALHPNRNAKGVTSGNGASSTLHWRLEGCQQQWRLLERERKLTEARLAVAFPGARVSSANSMPVPKLPPNPSRLDRLLVDMHREYTKVQTLVGKMNTLRAQITKGKGEEISASTAGQKVVLLKRGQTEQAALEEPKKLEIGNAPFAEIFDVILNWKNVINQVYVARQCEISVNSGMTNGIPGLGPNKMHMDEVAKHHVQAVANSEESTLQLALAVRELAGCADAARMALWCQLVLTAALAPPPAASPPPAQPLAPAPRQTGVETKPATEKTAVMAANQNQNQNQKQVNSPTKTKADAANQRAHFINAQRDFTRNNMRRYHGHGRFYNTNYIAAGPMH